jgi:hypothetical protein
MFTKKSTLLIAVALMAFAACKKSGGEEVEGANFNRSTSAAADLRTWPSLTSTIPATINGGTFVLTNDRVWILDGPTYVGSTGVLQIEPNTLIKGNSSSSRGTSYLVVTRGGRIEADGVSASTSIVFTSDKPAGQRVPGDWGGIILLGNAPVNQSPLPQIEGIISTEIPAGYSINYGGSDTAHNGGILRYVRIEFAGRDLGNNNEINGLTLGGVGNTTVLENIQVSYGQDDAFEFFGGTVNAKNLIALGNTDDDFDFDFGYVGKIQFAVALRDPAVHSVLSSDPNGIESDNDGASSLLTPRTAPILSNFTILGYSGNPSGLLNGVRFRRSSQFRMHNSIIAGWNNSGAFFDGPQVIADITSGVAQFRNNAVQSQLDDFNPNPGAWAGFSNNIPSLIGGSPVAFVRLVSPFTIANPDFRYVAGSPAASNFDYSTLPTPFFNTSLNYRGAFGAAGSARWDAVWASYQPQTNPY